MKRLISSNASDLTSYSAKELKQSIKASEGRTVCAENVAVREAFIGDITGAEIATAFGADLILLNGVDVLEPALAGIKNQKDFVNELKNLVGRPIGVNLEPIDPDAKMMDESIKISKGRTVNKESMAALDKLGMDFLCLTGNPGTGVTNKTITEAVKLAKENFSGLIIAGKMHSSGVDEPVTTAIGTSQEGSSKETIRQIAIANKICGVDIQHIGDAGYGGLAPVENIFEISVAIRGIRHTVSMMARSINR